MTEDMNPMDEEMKAAGMEGEVSDDDKLWALLSYIFPLLAVVALLMEDKKDRPFIKFHAIQALILFIPAAITSAACIGLLIWLYGIYIGFQAYKGEWTEIPFVTDFAKNQGWM